MDASGRRDEDRDGQPEEVCLVLLPENLTLRGRRGVSLLRLLQENGVAVGSSCGGRGICGECRIRFVDRPPDPTPADLSAIDSPSIGRGWRLACAHVLEEDARIECVNAGGELDHKASDDPEPPTGEIAPAVWLRAVHLPARVRDERRPQSERLSEGLGEDLRTPPSVLRRLAEASAERTEDFAVVGSAGEILDVRSSPLPSLCGLAIDVGTTTLAVYLVDLHSGRQLASAASRNPQRKFGADVISRIAHVRRLESAGLAELHAAVVEGLNPLIAETMNGADVPPDSAYAVTVVGNPTMLHLLLSVDPRGIDVSPYAPVFTRRVVCHGEDLGLAVHPRARVETLPAISAYVGADIVAGILAARLDERDGITLFLDVGTNGEVVLALDGRLLACSTAAGPAFEGASIVQGMPALRGAIESVRVHEGRVECSVVGDTAPQGLCGTGLVSAIAELFSVGAIDPSGRFTDVDSPLSARLEGAGSNRRFRLSEGDEPVWLHQRDVREFQLAKAAVRAGAEILLRRAGVGAEELDRVLVAGAFSRRLSGEHLVRTGLLPEVDPKKIDLVGDTAAQGAKLVLLNRNAMDDAIRLAARVEYVELSGSDGFRDAFVDSIPLPDRR